ncbi:MAG: hypothetical protein AAF688_09105, partial [Bacteroidota bacterium]
MIKNYILFVFMLPCLIFGQTIEFQSSITADLSAYSDAIDFPGLGEYEIFLDTTDGILDQPIILVDGFDPGDVRDINGIYGLLDFIGSNGNSNLVDELRALGFDVIILNFPQYLRLDDNSLLNIDDVTDNNGDMIIDETDYPAGSQLVNGGADFMERNAMLLVELINTINNDKVGDEENVIIGPSMGGLISRYALNFMENQSLEHETRLFISFDAPHLGANVPLGLQHQLNYLAFGIGNGLNVETLQPLINNLLKSPAARQLLTDHFESHLQTDDDSEFDPNIILPAEHPNKTIFDSSINSLTATGFPENTRNVAIINGSGIGSPFQDLMGNDVTPGYNLLNIEDLSLPDVPPLSNVTLNASINLTPATADGITSISTILVEGFFVVTIPLVNVQAFAQANSFSDGIDAAPGGLFDISEITGALGNGGIFDDFASSFTLNRFSFIPSVSAMAMNFTNDEINWYEPMDFNDMGTTTNGIMTPFDNWYMPEDNENHVQLTQENVEFALNEILDSSLENQELKEGLKFQIANNPVDDNLII